MKQFLDILLRSLRSGCLYMASRRVYLVLMILVPFAVTWFFLDMMDAGLPLKTPTAVVDLDQSALSRKITRGLSASQSLDVSYKAESFHDALKKVRSGEIFGFFYIPSGFQADAVSGKNPTLSYYSNMTYFVPGTLAFKGFKTVAVTTAGGIVQTTLVSTGVNPAAVGALLQPVAVSEYAIHNPWLNYNIYLTNSFIPGVIALMVMLVTAYSICEGIKNGSSVQWLKENGGSMLLALFGRLAPQTLVFSAVGIGCQAIMYGFCHFPLNNHALHIISAMVLMVIACQGFAVGVCSIIPNLRLSLSIMSLTGILTFSIAAFSYPVQSMYGAVGIFSYILPVRYYFLIYVDQALNGIPIFYSRWYYVALLLFPLVSLLGLKRLRGRCLHPVYVP